MLKTIILYRKEKEVKEDYDNFMIEIKNQGLAVKQLLHSEEIIQYFKERKESLLITDDIEIARQYKKIGYLVIGYRTQKNGNGDFSCFSYIIEGFEEIDGNYLNWVYSRLLGVPLIVMKTQRCMIREIQIKDLEELYEMYQDKLSIAYIDDLSEDKEEEIKNINTYIEQIYGFYNYGMWIVEEMDTKKIIGRAGIEKKVDAKGRERLELGYFIRKEHQRKGYGYEVCKEIITYVKQKSISDYLFIYTRKGNIASIKLCNKLGFHYLEQSIIKDKEYKCYNYRMEESY